MAAPTTRILSWEQMVREADGPEYTRLSLQPWVYSFSNNRRFIDYLPLYPTIPPDVLTESGGDLLLEDGAAIILE